MRLLQFITDASRLNRLVHIHHKKLDIELAQSGWEDTCLQFRPHGYNPHHWLDSPARSEKEAQNLYRVTANVLHLNLHPLATYRALGLEKVVDHWVPWVANDGWQKLTQDWGYLEQFGPTRLWGHIEHVGFWQELAKVLAHHDTASVYTQKLLNHAGWCGNLVPFNAVSFDQVQFYSSAMRTCHPRVALWLQSQGLLSSAQLVPSMDSFFDSDVFSPSASRFYRFLRWGSRSAIPIAYVQEWMQLMLANYPLTNEQKLILIGKAYMAFKEDAWTAYFEPVCRPYLHDVEMPLLQAICGNVSTQTNVLEDTVRLMSNSLSDPTIKSQNHPSQVHENLMLLAQISPPKNGLDVYHLAVAARKMDLNPTMSQQTLPLPELG